MAERKLPTAEDFPNNSDNKPVVKEKKRPDAVQSVVKGKVRSKESGVRKMRDEFISEDAGNVGSYILWDVLVPAVKDTILDILHGSIDMAFGGGTGGYYRRGGSSRGRSSNRSYISYDRMYDDRDRDRDRRRREDRRTRDQLEDLIFEYRDDADDVLDRMCDYLDRYGDVPVSYLYDLCGQTVPHDFTKDDWGWTNLGSAKVMRAHGGGYYIDFPKVRPL